MRSVLVLLAMISEAHAAPPRLSLEPGQRVQATITASGLDAATLSLHADTGWSAPPLDLHREHEPLALALVVSGHRLFTGSDEVEPPGLGLAGALGELRAAIDDGRLRDAGPDGSTVVVITYGAKATVRFGPAKLAALTGSVLGSQRDYLDATAQNLVDGVLLGLDQLRSMHAPRKVLLVIGDGGDADPNNATAALDDFLRRARAQSIQVEAIVFPHPLSSPDILSSLVPGAITIRTATKMRAALTRIVDRLPERYTATFDGSTLPRDGRTHRFELWSGDTVVGTGPLTLPSEAAPTWPWLLLAAGGGGLLVGIVFAWRDRRRSHRRSDAITAARA